MWIGNSSLPFLGARTSSHLLHPWCYVSSAQTKSTPLECLHLFDLLWPCLYLQLYNMLKLHVQGNGLSLAIDSETIDLCVTQYRGSLYLNVINDQAQTASISKWKPVEFILFFFCSYFWLCDCWCFSTSRARVEFNSWDQIVPFWKGPMFGLLNMLFRIPGIVLSYVSLLLASQVNMYDPVNLH